MDNLRKLIRKIILEASAITARDVNRASKRDGKKRYAGHMAKKVFADRADRQFLNSITYITTVSAERIDAWLSESNQKDELSCLAIGSKPNSGGELELPYDMSSMFENRISLVIEGWVTWLRNKNAATGHTGRILRGQHQGIRPSSGINKAPGKMYGRFAEHELDGVIMDEEDFENYDLQDFWDRPNKNNEALVDNWKVVGIVIPSKDLTGDLEIDFAIQDKISLEAYEKLKERWPEAELYRGVFD